MGGRGSGTSLSDEEKKARGTFRAEKSTEARKDKAEAQVISGPWLSSIPEPEYPLNDVGRKKYDDITRWLFDSNKLTTSTHTLASLAGLYHQKLSKMAGEDRAPTASDLTQYRGVIRDLRIAEDAKPIASPGQANKFSGSGFANRRSAEVRLRSSGPADPRDRGRRTGGS